MLQQSGRRRLHLVSTQGLLPAISKPYPSLSRRAEGIALLPHHRHLLVLRVPHRSKKPRQLQRDLHQRNHLRRKCLNHHKSTVRGPTSALWMANNDLTEAAHRLREAAVLQNPVCPPMTTMRMFDQLNELGRQGPPPGHCHRRRTGVHQRLNNETLPRNLQGKDHPALTLTKRMQNGGSQQQMQQTRS